MEVTLLVKTIESLPTKNGKGSYWKITDAEGKHTNVMPGTPGRELLAENKMLKFTKEQKGDFWNVVKIEEATPNAPRDPLPATPKVNGTQPTQPDNKLKSVSFSYAKDLVVAGIIPLSDIYNCAWDFERYLNGGFKPIYKEDWMGK